MLKVPKDPKSVTETDFQEHALEFAGDTTTVRTTDGKEFTIDAMRTYVTANNARQQWTKNPIPEKLDSYAMPKGLTSKNFYNTDKSQPYWNWKFSLIDEVKIPSNLAPGDYYISWRWDAGSAPQNFNNCGDVKIVSDGESTLLPAHGKEGAIDASGGSNGGNGGGGTGGGGGKGGTSESPSEQSALLQRFQVVIITWVHH